MIPSSKKDRRNEDKANEPNNHKYTSTSAAAENNEKGGEDSRNYRYTAAAGNDKIITINAEGTQITTLRSTLTIPTDSMWSNMFSGRWEEALARDTDGHIFLDYDEELITIIVNGLFS